MAVQNLVDPVPLFSLPLSKGGDLIVTFVYMAMLVDEENDPILDDNGKEQFVATDYPDGSVLTFTIEHSAGDVEQIAVISGSEAVVVIDKLLVNPIKNNALWRAILTDIDDLDIPFCNGFITRYDGRPPIS